MSKPDWAAFAQLGGLRSVLDPMDTKFKNRLIDALHWAALKKELATARRLLDFGCGTGRFATRLLKMGIDYTGVDSCPEMIDKARELNADANFCHCDRTTMPFRANEFDTCLSCWVFQYIIGEDDRQHIVDEIVRVIKPGGTLILLEQASLSGRTSGTVETVSTESDYIDMLAKRFAVRGIRRIRTCATPQLS